jgi:CheY-like chemotaxis protein
MADGSGWDLIAAIRRLPPERGGVTPALSMSAAENRELALQAGFHLHFAKPLDTDAVAAAIRALSPVSQSGVDVVSAAELPVRARRVA